MSRLSYNENGYSQSIQKASELISLIDDYSEFMTTKRNELANLCSEKPKIFSDSFLLESDITFNIDCLKDISSRLSDLINYEHYLVDKINNGTQSGDFDIDTFSAYLLQDILLTSFNNYIRSLNYKMFTNVSFRVTSILIQRLITRYPTFLF